MTVCVQTTPLTCGAGSESLDTVAGVPAAGAVSASAAGTAQSEREVRTVAEAAASATMRCHRGRETTVGKSYRGEWVCPSRPGEGRLGDRTCQEYRPSPSTHPAPRDPKAGVKRQKSTFD